MEEAERLTRDGITANVLELWYKVAHCAVRPEHRNKLLRVAMQTAKKASCFGAQKYFARQAQLSSNGKVDDVVVRSIPLSD